LQVIAVMEIAPVYAVTSAVYRVRVSCVTVKYVVRRRESVQVIKGHWSLVVLIVDIAKKALCSLSPSLDTLILLFVLVIGS
jgi:hypothetical protein